VIDPVSQRPSLKVRLRPFMMIRHHVTVCCPSPITSPLSASLPLSHHCPSVLALSSLCHCPSPAAVPSLITGLSQPPLRHANRCPLYRVSPCSRRCGCDIQTISSDAPECALSHHCPSPITAPLPSLPLSHHCPSPITAPLSALSSLSHCLSPVVGPSQSLPFSHHSAVAALPLSHHCPSLSTLSSLCHCTSAVESSIN